MTRGGGAIPSVGTSAFELHEPPLIRLQSPGPFGVTSVMNASQNLRRLAVAALAAMLLAKAPLIAQTIRYVNANAPAGGNGLAWATAYQAVPPAIAAANAGDEVWVAKGSYAAPAGGYAINKRLALYGGFKGTETDHEHRLGSFLGTVLEGDIGVLGNPLDNVPHVITTTGVAGIGAGAGVLIDGFLIQNGYAQGAGVNGAGILCVQTDLDLANCFIRNNLAPGALTGNANAGGGVYFTSYVGGVSPPLGNQLRIKNCEFSDNTGCQGGALYADMARGAVVDTEFLGNRAFPHGGGAYVLRNGPGTRLDFTNCVFWNNSCSVSGLGGGLYVDDLGPGLGGNVQVVNCTFSDNYGNAGTDGQALVASAHSSVDVSNSIFYFNGSGGGGSPAPILGSATVSYSDVEGGYAGASNIQADPKFANHGIGRLTLLLNSTPPSPCLDAADYARLPADSLDVDSDGNLVEPIPLDAAAQARLIDQASIGDSGSGSLAGAYACPLCTYLDMGALERP